MNELTPREKEKFESIVEKTEKINELTSKEKELCERMLEKAKEEGSGCSEGYIKHLEDILAGTGKKFGVFYYANEEKFNLDDFMDAQASAFPHLYSHRSSNEVKPFDAIHKCWGMEIGGRRWSTTLGRGERCPVCHKMELDKDGNEVYIQSDEGETNIEEVKNRLHLMIKPKIMMVIAKEAAEHLQLGDEFQYQFDKYVITQKDDVEEGTQIIGIPV